MKILILDTYYLGFLNSFYLKDNHSKSTYDEQKKALLNSNFGTSDYYSYNLKKLGHQTEDLIVNDPKLQQKWAKENKIKVNTKGVIQKLQSLPFLYRFIGRPDWVQRITIEQIKRYSPDVLYIQDLSVLNTDTLRECKKFCKLVVGQIACPLPPEKNLKAYDLILTSFPHYVARFRKMGVASEYFKIGFEKRLLKKVKATKRIYPVTFIGSFSPHHHKGTKLLEKLAMSTPVHVWGQGINFLSSNSPLRKNYHGEAWGINMYTILSQSKIVVNRHISAAENFANNMRLYETTGMGAMLITDHKDNLSSLFEIGKEVVEYHNIKDLTRLIQYYLKNDKQRERIAYSGQIRTLKDHSYGVRMKELEKILSIYLQSA